MAMKATATFDFGHGTACADQSAMAKRSEAMTNAGLKKFQNVTPRRTVQRDPIVLAWIGACRGIQTDAHAQSKAPPGFQPFQE